MYRRMGMVVLGVLLVLSFLTVGCSDDDDSTAFRLNACELDDADCRLQ